MRLLVNCTVLYSQQYLVSTSTISLRIQKFKNFPCSDVAHSRGVESELKTRPNVTPHTTPQREGCGLHQKKIKTNPRIQQYEIAEILFKNCFTKERKKKRKKERKDSKRCPNWFCYPAINNNVRLSNIVNLDRCPHIQMQSRKTNSVALKGAECGAPWDQLRSISSAQNSIGLTISTYWASSLSIAQHLS